MTTMRPMRDSSLMQMLKHMTDAAAAWRGLARQFYDSHQRVHRGTACACPVCAAYRQRVEQESRPAVAATQDGE